MKIFFATIIVFTSAHVYSQSTDGNWDTYHATLNEIKLDAGDRTWRRIQLPPGTTEIGIRITLLEDNQTMANSFANLLGAIPTKQTQIASASVHLLSSIVGDDNCTYAIFSDQSSADGYYKKGLLSNACYIHNNEISRDVTFIRDGCMLNSPQNLYVGFHSSNLVFHERIILEVVPWVNNNIARGWTQSRKDNFLQDCLNTVKEYELSAPEVLCGCIEEKVEQKYTVTQFENLNQFQNKAIEHMVKDCAKESGEIDKLLYKDRKIAYDYGQQHDYVNALFYELDIINEQMGTAFDYNAAGWYYILSKQYLKAIKYLKDGEKLDETDLSIKLNLAHAYLFSNEIDIATEMYAKYNNQNIDNNSTWKDKAVSDLDFFKNEGLPSNNFETVYNIFNQ